MISSGDQGYQLYIILLYLLTETKGPFYSKMGFTSAGV